MATSRRDFLRTSTCALGAAALLTGIEQFGMVNAFAQQSSPDFTPSGYKALVCIFLSGGNDGNNTVIPYTDYNNPGGYAAVRSGSTLAIPQANLLQVQPLSTQSRVFGFHPNMVEMQQLFQQQRLAVLCNTGTLVQPLNKSQYQSGVGRPSQLFSHSDQVAQQQSSVSTNVSQTGWGGRTADQLFSINGSAPLPMIITLAGTTLFATGTNTRQLSVGDSNTPLSSVLVLSGFDSTASSIARRAAYDQLRTIDNNAMLVRASSDVTTQALQASAALSTNPTITTTFPTNFSIGRQLLQVARLIKANFTQASLGLNRQIFFCSLGGFDTHSGQLAQQVTLLAQLSQAMKAFYDFTNTEMNIANQVTTFTMSDFGRTFLPGGSGTNVGSDHGWGNHQFIMGGAVRGGDFYGTYPTLALGGPDDTDSGSTPRGRWIPTTSVDQYAATLASWYGLASSDIPLVFPFVSRFPSANLGFLM